MLESFIGHVCRAVFIVSIQLQLVYARCATDAVLSELHDQLAKDMLADALSLCGS